MVDERPFENVKRRASAFWLPRRKWRELVFIGALVPDGDFFVREPTRPMPVFRDPDLFPEGVRFRVHLEDDEQVRIERVD